MAAISLKLPDDLKRRIAQLVSGSGRTAHSFMVEAIEQAVLREELRRRFGEEAALSEREAQSTPSSDRVHGG
jgi:predicted transcriptional regulator